MKFVVSASQARVKVKQPIRKIGCCLLCSELDDNKHNPCSHTHLLQAVYCVEFAALPLSTPAEYQTVSSAVGAVYLSPTMKLSVVSAVLAVVVVIGLVNTAKSSTIPHHLHHFPNKRQGERSNLFTSMQQLSIVGLFVTYDDINTGMHRLYY